MRRSAWVFVGVVLVATTAFGGEGGVRRSARHIPGRYLVALESGADTATVANTVRGMDGGRVHQTYKKGFKGLAVELTDGQAQALSRDKRVQFVEEDATIDAAATAPWGLDRIDQRLLPLNGTYINGGTGAGVTIYVIDTGVAADHDDFGGRVVGGFTAFDDGKGTYDCNGHGTHVAGVAAGASHGVARSAKIVPVRVLNCNGSGSLSSVLAGIDWVLTDHAQNPGPAVANLSLVGEASSLLDSSTETMIADGVTTVVAAGNTNTDACHKSPARVPGALTVGASTETDDRASFSNYGPCVDLFAPGTRIESAWYASKSSVAIMSGTSQAAPFVAGVAALALEKEPAASVAVVAGNIIAQSSFDVLKGVEVGSPNRLLFANLDTLDQNTADLQLLADPGFEFGTTFWTADICSVTNPTGCPPDVDPGTDPTVPPLPEFDIGSLPAHGGNTRATIGGPSKTFQVISETVTIPSGVRKAELSLYLWIVTKNKKHSVADVLTVEIRNAAGTEVLGTFSNLDANKGYALHRYDVTRFRGVPIRISFTGVQTQGPPTWFLLDDVSLNIWGQ